MGKTVKRKNRVLSFRVPVEFTLHHRAFLVVNLANMSPGPDHQSPKYVGGRPILESAQSAPRVAPSLLKNCSVVP